MTIDGQAVTSPGTLKVINPATGEVFAEVPDCTREQLEVAMQSAQANAEELGRAPLGRAGRFVSPAEPLVRS